MRHRATQNPSSVSPPPAATATSRPEQRDLLVALNACPGLGRTAICRLGASVEAWSRGGTDLPSLARALGLAPAQVERAQALGPRAAAIARRELRQCDQLGGSVVTLADRDYPSALLDLDLPPPVLYCVGELPRDAPAIAIVGPRNADPYGREAAHFMSRGLAAQGMPVVSGFARGVDAAAHRGALEAPEGRTVAVLGCGLGVRYPKEHWELFAEIVASGAVVTEFPCRRPPQPWHFPVRNRIIAALGVGTLVVQAAQRSGALITARYALELGREVWAVPGRIFDSRSAGVNSLIRDGAHLVQEPRDILESLTLALQDQLSTRPRRSLGRATPELEPHLDKILRCLGPGEARTPEEVAAAAAMAVEEVLPGLLELELAGWIERRPGGVFGRQHSVDVRAKGLQSSLRSERGEERER